MDELPPPPKKTSPLKGKRPPCIGKGSSFEWTTARALSKWLTAGQDDSQFVRSVLSGGNTRLRSVANSRPEYQVGDLAPNGPEAERFRRVFGIECKNYGPYPEWWHNFTVEKWETEEWWKKINLECAPHNLQPLLIMKRNRYPTVVMMRTALGVGFEFGGFTLHRLGSMVVKMEDFFRQSPDHWISQATMLKGVPDIRTP